MNERLRRRRRLMARSAPVVLLALLAAALLLGVSLGSVLARAAYDAGSHADAVERYTYQKTWTPVVIEPWKAWYGAGTAQVRRGEHFQGVEELRGALERVPAGAEVEGGGLDPASAECQVRTNLSLGLEAMGDDAMAAADPGMAEAYYTQAMDVIGVCSTDGESESDDEQPEPPESEQDRTEQRQKGKQEGAGEEQEQQRSEQAPDDAPDRDGAPEPDGQGGEDAPPDGDGAEEQPSDPQQRELQERNREAERERRQQEQERGGGFGGGQNW